jgi:hypothetical protein
MSQAEQTTSNADFTPVHDVVPNPSKIAHQYDARIDQVKGEFSGDKAKAQQALSKAKSENGFWAKRSEFAEKRQTVDERHEEATQEIEAQSAAVATELNALLQKEKQLSSGALKHATKRAEAEAVAVQMQIEELTDLRNILQEVVDLGIDVPHIDVDGDGVVDGNDHASLDIDGDGTLDADDITALDAKIDALKNKVTNDPVLSLLTKQLAALHSGVEVRQEKLAEVSQAAKEEKDAWSKDVTKLREEIKETRSGAVVSAKDEFNEVARQADAAVLSVSLDKQAAVEAEKAARDQYVANEREDRRQTRSNTVSGIFNGIAAAWQTFKTTVSDAYNEKTDAAKANEELLEARRAKIESGDAPATPKNM